MADNRLEIVVKKVEAAHEIALAVAKLHADPDARAASYVTAFKAAYKGITEAIAENP